MCHARFLLLLLLLLLCSLSFIKEASVFSLGFELPTDPNRLSQVTQAVTWHFLHIVHWCWSLDIYVRLSCSSPCVASSVHFAAVWVAREQCERVKRKTYSHTSLIDSVIMAGGRHDKYLRARQDQDCSSTTAEDVSAGKQCVLVNPVISRLYRQNCPFSHTVTRSCDHIWSRDVNTLQWEKSSFFLKSSL